MKKTELMGFMMTFGEFCKSHATCNSCPLNDMPGDEFCIVRMCADPSNARFAIETIEEWRAEEKKKTERKTILSEFLKKFPNTPLGTDGTPHFCVKVLGYNYTDEDICEVNQCCCTACWKTVLEDNRPAEPGIVREYAEHKKAQQPIESMSAEEFIVDLIRQLRQGEI